MFKTIIINVSRKNISNFIVKYENNFMHIFNIFKFDQNTYILREKELVRNYCNKLNFIFFLFRQKLFMLTKRIMNHITLITITEIIHKFCILLKREKYTSV